MDAIRDLSRAGCLHPDQQDCLSSFRENFLLPEGLIYLDGNSLGAPLHESKKRVAETLRQEWGEGLIQSFSTLMHSTTESNIISIESICHFPDFCGFPIED